jgi:hypothetical protein
MSATPAGVVMCWGDAIPEVRCATSGYRLRSLRDRCAGAPLVSEALSKTLSGYG